MLFEEYKVKFQNIKFRIGLERNIGFLRGIFLIIICAIALTVDPFISEFTIYYLFPIALMYFGVETLYIANETKKLAINHWLLEITIGYIFIALAFYFIFAPVIAGTEMAVYLGLFALIKAVVTLTTLPNKLNREYISLIIVVIVSFFIIAFPHLISTMFYWATLSLIIVYGIYKIWMGIILTKIINKNKEEKKAVKTESKPIKKNS